MENHPLNWNTLNTITCLFTEFAQMFLQMFRTDVFFLCVCCFFLGGGGGERERERGERIHGFSMTIISS